MRTGVVTNRATVRSAGATSGPTFRHAVGVLMRTQQHRRWSIIATAIIGLVCAAGCAHRTDAPADGLPASSLPAGATVAALAPPAPPHAGFDYRIQPYDELHVRFPYQPDVDEQVPVRPDGRISLATTGELVVVGMTPAEVEALIKEKSSARLRKPEVVVVVTKV